MSELLSIKNRLNSVIDDYENTPDLMKVIDEILTDIQESKDALDKKKLSIFFPKQSSKDEELQRMGLTEESNAMLFLSTPQPSQSIKSKLINAIELNKIDFASTIFQKLLPQIPSDDFKWNELKLKSTEKYNLLLSVSLLYKNFCEQREINSITKEIEELNELETRAIQFKKNINKFELTNN